MHTQGMCKEPVQVSGSGEHTSPQVGLTGKKVSISPGGGDEGDNGGEHNRSELTVKDGGAGIGQPTGGLWVPSCPCEG